MSTRSLKKFWITQLPGHGGLVYPEEHALGGVAFLRISARRFNSLHRFPTDFV